MDLTERQIWTAGTLRALLKAADPRTRLDINGAHGDSTAVYEVRIGGRHHDFVMIDCDGGLRPLRGEDEWDGEDQ